MTLTKKIGKTVLVCMLALISMTGMAFASGTSELSQSPIISGGGSWIGVIDGIAIDLNFNTSTNSIEGTVTNLLPSDVSNTILSINNGQGTNVASITLGVIGDLEFNDIVIKEDTAIISRSSSVPVALYLSNAQEQSLLNNGWSISIDSDNAPRYGLFEKGELLALEATSIADSFVINENGIQTVISYTHEDYILGGHITNYTNQEVSNLTTNIALSNGSVLTYDGGTLQPGQTAFIEFGVEDESGFTMYAVETSFN